MPGPPSFPRKSATHGRHLDPAWYGLVGRMFANANLPHLRRRSTEKQRKPKNFRAAAPSAARMCLSCRGAMLDPGLKQASQSSIEPLTRAFPAVSLWGRRVTSQNLGKHAAAPLYSSVSVIPNGLAESMSRMRPTILRWPWPPRHISCASLRLEM